MKMAEATCRFNWASVFPESISGQPAPFVHRVSNGPFLTDEAVRFWIGNPVLALGVGEIRTMLKLDIRFFFEISRF
jgi:hypothetical protein